MKLYLIRHGEAQDVETDPERGLSPRGREEVKKVAAYLAELGVSPAVIQHSPKARAMQTAAIIAEGLSSSPTLAQRDGIAPNDPVVRVAKEIASCDSDTMLVSHLPFVPRLAETLLGSDAPSGLGGLLPGGLLILEGHGEIWRFVRRLMPADL